MPDPRIRAYLGIINRMINTQIRYRAESRDPDGKQQDHWQSPEETTLLGRGDCEDFAILKMSSLIGLGIPRDDLRLCYTHTDDYVAHIILAYKQQVVLDNLRDTLTLLSDYPLPLYSVDGNGTVFTAKGQRTDTRFARFDRILLGMESPA